MFTTTNVRYTDIFRPDQSIEYHNLKDGTSRVLEGPGLLQKISGNLVRYNARKFSSYHPFEYGIYIWASNASKLGFDGSKKSTFLNWGPFLFIALIAILITLQFLREFSETGDKELMTLPDMSFYEPIKPRQLTKRGYTDINEKYYSWITKDMDQENKEIILQDKSGRVEINESQVIITSNGYNNLFIIDICDAVVPQGDPL
jgi:hypothetical protein